MKTLYHPALDPEEVDHDSHYLRLAGQLHDGVLDELLIEVAILKGKAEKKLEGAANQGLAHDCLRHTVAITTLNKVLNIRKTVLDEMMKINKERENEES